MTSFEGFKDVFISFFIELVATFILLLVIFSNFKADSTYRKILQIGDTAYTFGTIVTGVTLILLIYTTITIALKFGISAGHMFPLITIPAMFGKMGLVNVSVPKGLVLLLAQFIAMGLAVLTIFGAN